MAEIQRRITPSKIVYVIEGGPPSTDQEAARRGREAHRTIIGQMEAGDIPLSLRRAGLIGPIRGEVREQTRVGDGLILGVRVDAEGGPYSVELKPGQLRGRHLLQTAADCMAREMGPGVVYLYTDGSAAVLNNGGKEAWPGIVKMAADAADILEIQDELRCRPKNRHALGQRAVKIRQGFDQTTGKVMQLLARDIIKIR